MKFKKIISLIASGALALSMCAANISADEKGIPVKTPEELMSMTGDGNYYLDCNINLTGEDWKPITGFSGSLDGNSYKISGLTSETYGLFSSLGSGAEIENVTLTDVYITSKFKNVGAIAGIIQSCAENVKIENCFVDGVVAFCPEKFGIRGINSANGAVGSIVGVNNSPSCEITGCYSNAVVTSEWITGGLVGINRGTITNSGFEGTIENTHNIFDLAVGENGTVTEEYRFSYVTGGICGINYGSIGSSFSNCRMDRATYYGGIAGALQGSGEISYCVNSTLVPYGGFDGWNGGLIAGIATAKTSVSNCYTVYPTDETAQDDIGKSGIDSVTYGVKKENYGNIKSFPLLGDDWTLYQQAPVLKALIPYMDEMVKWTVSSGHLDRYMAIA